MNTNNPHLPASGPATGAFNGTHAKSKFLAAIPPRRNLGILVLLLAVMVPTNLQAQNRNNQNRNNQGPVSQKGAPSELPTVSRVGAGMITVGKKTYEVPESAIITVNGNEAQLSDIKPGMQASVAGSVSKFGKTKADTLYKATRISVRNDNKLGEKRKAFNSKQCPQSQRINQQRRNQNKR